ncbi:ABC transporter ATP-binding protein [Shinella sp.]|uniref:ABC transporter ATP-binding protein n=1 Tax=Shinella sp. TaxID=1870904 RepID=UPI003F724105
MDFKSQQHNVLEVERLNVSFGAPPRGVSVVRDVSFKAVSGRTVAIVGESGSGKSVTSLALLGLLKARRTVVTGDAARFTPSGGQTTVDLLKLDASQMRAVRGTAITMIFQEPMSSLNPSHTLEYQVGETLRVHHGATRRQAREAAIAMLERVGIPDAARRADSYPHEISGGMRQRVMIASALISRPALLIADEPTTALDVTIQAQILEELKRLQDEIGMSMIFITHDLGVVAEIAHTVVVMYAGQVVEQGTVADILQYPNHPYTRALLASVPRLERPRSSLEAITGRIPDPLQEIPGCRFHPRCSFAVKGRCDVQAPELESAGDDRSVRCLRWRELGAA